MNIWDLERKILNNVPLSSQEMHCVEQSLVSEQMADKILGCEGLLRLGDNRQKDIAVRTISRTVGEVNSGACEMTPDLVMTFFLLPESTLNQTDYKTVLTTASSHPDEGVRTNCMVALQPLAKSGLDWVRVLLERGLEDSNADVRQNARVALDFFP
jgi:hypothetical protein